MMASSAGLQVKAGISPDADRAMACHGLLQAEWALERAGLAALAADVRGVQAALFGGQRVAAKESEEAVNWLRWISYVRTQPNAARGRFRPVCEVEHLQEVAEAVSGLSAGPLLVLARLLERPGATISKEELRRYAAVHSDSAAVVKVYVCLLRRVFSRAGIGQGILTKGKGYCIPVAVGRRIIEIVTLTRTMSFSL